MAQFVQADYALGRARRPDRPANAGVSTVPARLHVAPAQDLAARNVDSFGGADRRLAVAPDSASPPYDLVVVDCGPTLYGLFVAATFAAVAVLLVNEPAANALEGLPRTSRWPPPLRRSAPPTSDRCCSGCCRPASLVTLGRASCSSGGCTSYGFEPDVNKGSSRYYNVVIMRRCSATQLSRFGPSTLRHWPSTGPQPCGLVPPRSSRAAGL